MFWSDTKSLNTEFDWIITSISLIQLCLKVLLYSLVLAISVGGDTKRSTQQRKIYLNNKGNTLQHLGFMLLPSADGFDTQEPVSIQC